MEAGCICVEVASSTCRDYAVDMSARGSSPGRAQARMEALSPKSSFEELDYEERLLAIESARLQGLHHSTGLSPPASAHADDDRKHDTFSKLVFVRCKNESLLLLPSATAHTRHL